MTQETDKLCERLRASCKEEGDLHLFAGDLINPDGPEAADLIERLSAPDLATENAVEREGLAEAMRLIEYDMLNRRYGDGDGFVGERREVAKVIVALRAAIAALPAPDPVEVEAIAQRAYEAGPPVGAAFMDGPCAPWAELDHDVRTAAIHFTRNVLALSQSTTAGAEGDEA